VHFKVTSEKEDEIVVEYSSHGHEEQEQNDALSKQVTRSAEETERGERDSLTYITSRVKSSDFRLCHRDQLKDLGG